MVELLLAIGLLTACLAWVAPSSVALLASWREAQHWLAAVDEVRWLLQRFAGAPCTIDFGPGGEVSAGGIRFRWSADAQAGTLVAVAWPPSAPVAIRRGLLRVTLPCR